MSNARADHQSGAALLIIDMMNDLDFADANEMIPWLDGVADAIERLRTAADAARVPVVYINDNYGEWHSDRERIIDAVCERSRRPDLVERLRPRRDDYFVIKPQFSGFYATNLPVLLPTLGADQLILTGIATDLCVLFTAGDAHMRNYGLWVPSDATACPSDRRRDWSLDIFAKSMGAETRSSSELSLETWLGET